MAKSKPKFRVGQVVWHDGYQRYFCIHSVVFLDQTKEHHSYIVSSTTGQGTVQIFADQMRPLTATEIGPRRKEKSK